MYGGKFAFVALEPVVLILVLTLMPVLAVLVVVLPDVPICAEPEF
jgi:hypothetical protein